MKLPNRKVLILILSTMTVALNSTSVFSEDHKTNQLEGQKLDFISGPLEINQAISEGLGKSPMVQKAEASFQEASWHKTGTLSGFLPSLKLTANHFFSAQYQFLNINLGGSAVRFPMVYAQTTVDLGVQLPLFDGLQNLRVHRAGNFQKDASEDDSNWVRFKVEQDIRLKYLQALGAEKLEDVAQHNLKTLTDHLEQIRLLRKGGISTSYDVLRVEVQVNEAQSEALQAEDNRILARQRLSLAMGIPDDVRTLQGDLPIPDSTHLASVEIKTAQANRGDLRAVEGRLRASQELETASGAFWVPRISLGADYQLYNNSDFGFDPANYSAASNIGLFLTWNIFDGLASISRSKEASYQAIQSEKQLDQLKLQVPYDFNFWKRRCLYSTNLYLARNSDVAKAMESVRLSRDGFKAGARTNTEVLDAEFDLFRARAGVVNSQLNYSEALINLELVLGKKIESHN